MRGTKSLLTALVVAGLLVGCQSKQNEPIRSSSTTGGTSVAPSAERADQSNMALVRFINADPSMKTVSAYMDSNQAFADVSFKTVTPYREVPDGSHDFHLGNNASMQAGRDNDHGRISESKSLSSGDYYTVVLRPNDDKNNHGPKLDVIKDDFGSPSKDKAQIRVIDAAVNAGKVDVVVHPKNDKLFSNLDVSSSPSYKDVDPGNISLSIENGKNNNALFTLPNTTVDAGHYYTIVITGKGTNGRNLDAVIVEDQYAMHRDTNQGSSDAMEKNRDRDNDRDNDNNTNR